MSPGNSIGSAKYPTVLTAGFPILLPLATYSKPAKLAAIIEPVPPTNRVSNILPVLNVPFSVCLGINHRPD